MYFPYEEIKKIGQRYVHNPLLQGRGLPGTHDVDLAVKTIKQLQQHSTNPAPGEVPYNDEQLGKRVVLLPSYDKGARDGEGDRSLEWIPIECPVDIVFLDGWFLGNNSVCPMSAGRP